MALSSFKDNVYEMQLDRYNVFKSQDLQKGNFDVKFEIQEKIIYAHKFLLTPISETLDAWLSDRWTTKDEIIKIESCTYDCFYQFLSFIYIGNCELTNENIREMVDLAEFYAVSCFKNFCEEYLSTMEFPSESIEGWYDFAQQYSLPIFTESVKNYINQKGDIVIRENIFSSFKKPFVQFFSSALDGKFREEFFEAIYKWSEHNVMKQDTSVANDGNIDLQEKIKAELYTIIPDPNFYEMKFEFLMNFVVEHGFPVSPSEFFSRNYRSRETSFKWTYELAEKQALKKQKNATKNDEVFDVAASIQSDLAEVIPQIEFYKMSKQFLLDFVLEKGYLFSAADLLKFFINMYYYYAEEKKRFEYVYQIAEKQVLKKQAMTPDSGDFNLDNSIKDELVEVIPRVKFYWMDYRFLMDFVLEKGFLLSATTLLKFFTFSCLEYEQRFQYVYQIAEKQALKKQKISPDPDNFNIADSIKADMAEVMPEVKFYYFDKQFLQDFVVANGIISKEDANRVYETRVEVKNDDQALNGFFIDDYGIRRMFDQDGSQRTVRNFVKKLRYNKVKISIPETPSPVMKMKGVKWYLCFEKDGVFTVKHHQLIGKNDYLIAHMGSNDDFRIEETLVIHFSDNV